MRLSKRMYDDYQSENFNPDERYRLAYKKVKRIKGFYVHAIVYILVNAYLIISSYSLTQHSDKDFFNWGTFSTALFWGIGLLAHGLSVFGRNIFFGKNWEERKIQEFIEKERASQSPKGESENWI